jgi:predicted ATPase/DNA-binding SARP family transcriptional activator
MPRLQVFLFGTPRVILNGQEVMLARLKSLALLAHLLVENRVESRNALATLLWPESSQAAARTYLRQAFYLLQKMLGKRYFIADDETIGVAPQANIEVDVWQFEQYLIAADNEPVQAVCHWRAAVDLVHVDFLDGFTLTDAPAFDDWEAFQRQRLHQMLMQTLDNLVQHLVHESDYAGALDYARRRVQLDPLDDAGRCALIQVLARRGQTAAALREYDEFVDLLRQELDLPPAPETMALVDSIRHDVSAACAISRPYGDQLPFPTTFKASNLPHPLTPFVGRERELAELSGLIADPATRLITITAPGGMGKTRLALAVAQTVDPKQFVHGVFFVSLASLNQEESLVPAVARALGMTLQPGPPPLEQLTDYLRDRNLLLVLDNFEHLLPQARVIAQILRMTSGAQILITSRERLHLSAEQVYPIQGLAYGALSTADPAESAAVRLFEQCAHRNAPDFVLGDEVLADVMRICHLVEGMPLAIELAAAWIGMLSPAQIAAEIERNLNFLTAEMHDAPQRHQSIHAAFDATWQRLNQDERRCFSALSVFRGLFSREAAIDVTGASLLLLNQLANKSLIRYDRRRDGYTIHELMRQYGREQLCKDAFTLAQIEERHCIHYSRFLENRLSAINTVGQRQAADEVSMAWDNVRAAWQWAVEHIDINALHPSAGTIFLFCQIRSHFADGVKMFADAATALYARPPSKFRDLALAQIRNHEGWLAIRVGDFERAQSTLEESQHLYDKHQTAPRPMMGSDPGPPLGIVHLILGDRTRARRLCEDALVAAEARQDHYNRSYAHYVLTSIHHAAGDYPSANHHAQQACELAEAVGNRWFKAIPLVEWGKVARANGDYVQAGRHFKDAYDIKRDFEDPEGMAVALNHLGEIALLQGNLPEADRRFRRALITYLEINDRGGLATAQRGLGAVASAQGEFVTARRWLGSALVLATETHFWPLVFTILLDVAEVFLAEGDYGSGIALLAQINQRPQLDHETRSRMWCLLHAWRSRVEPHCYADAISRGEVTDFQDTIERLLDAFSASPSSPIPQIHSDTPSK